MQLRLSFDDAYHGFLEGAFLDAIILEIKFPSGWDIYRIGGPCQRSKNEREVEELHVVQNDCLSVL